MLVVYDISLDDFEAWQGGLETLKRLRELQAVEKVETLVLELYPDGLTDVELNDFLWFEDGLIAETVGMSDLWED